ncbi:dentin sialophosphoprotein [Pimephales promelas]|nr:dentin sialophosphoprotein [Pimephales promelas]
MGKLFRLLIFDATLCDPQVTISVLVSTACTTAVKPLSSSSFCKLHLQLQEVEQLSPQKCATEIQSEQDKEQRALRPITSSFWIQGDFYNDVLWTYVILVEWTTNHQKTVYISAFSSVTLLSTDELDRLLDDVRGLGDDTLQKYEDVQVVVLHKEVGSGLGFTLAGGVDQNKPVTVHRVIPGGVAAHEGSIYEGARVLSINGTALQNSAHFEALRTLRKARGQGMAVVVLQSGNSRREATEIQGITGRRVRVTLEKSSSDLGFSLEGGVGSSSGDKPLTVKKIFRGGPVSEVFPGDELLEMQGQRLAGMMRLEAWNLIKKLPSGPVEVLLHRPHQPH